MEQKQPEKKKRGKRYVLVGGLLLLCCSLGCLMLVRAQADTHIYLPLVQRGGPTPIPPLVYVLPNHSWYRVDLPSVMGWPHIVGEIQNDSVVGIYNVRVPVAILDSSGREIGTDIGATPTMYLASARKTCFECILDDEPQNWTTYELGTVTYVEQFAPRSDIFRLSDEHMAYDGSGYKITGKARHNVHPCPPHCYTPSITATFYDANGKVAGCRFGSARSIGGSGNDYTFEIYLKRNWQEGITYELYVASVFIP